MHQLLAQPLNQDGVRQAVGLTSGSASKQLKILEERQLIARERSHSPYRIVAQLEMTGVLQAVADLAAAISLQQSAVDTRYARDFRKARLRQDASQQRPSSGNVGPS